MIDLKELYRWCSVPVEELVGHSERKVALRLVQDAKELGIVMAREFAEDIKAANSEGRVYRAIIPCGPKEWYDPFAAIVNQEGISLKNMVCFHMDENLDWEAKPLPKNDPNNFHTFMEKYFYEAVNPELRVPQENRLYLNAENIYEISRLISEVEIDYCLGGFGQDGHIAFNQANRNPYVNVTIDDIRNSTARIQENNMDTIIALSQRSLGSAWQFMPPMSVTLGAKECLKAKKIRVYSATGAWKQTALRVALFSEITAEYPITLLQEHSDSMITTTVDTAIHPISENPQWEFKAVHGGN